ncbi:MAG: hypothetical protein U9Q81_04025 [Pseudomonadota bacterium]|nr:hypothetical protein [Pseudomonadota bacterium]
MIRLTKTLNAWRTPEFESVLKCELEAMDAQVLPLQQGLARGSHVGDDRFSVMLISVAERTDSICTTIGVFYTGIIAGCSCADDPTPIDAHPEYCEVQVDIDKATAETTLTLLPG